MKPVFTDNWVRKAEDHEAHWREWTVHLPLPRILEIGSFEGRSALLWRRIHPHSEIHCVDVFGGHHDVVHPGYEARFDATTGKDRRIYKPKGPSKEILPTLKGPFDIVYIDGDHTEEAVFDDAVKSWAMLNPEGGVLIFDDYEWYYGASIPKPAVDRFLAMTKGYDLLHKGWQVAMRRMY